MTSKTSFFNKGIYKSTVKRYAWGSVLYFVLLFFSAGMSVFLDFYPGMPYGGAYYYHDNPVILSGSRISIPVLLAIVVPTVVALLVFRFIHSKKQAIFIHSLPVSRQANFISSLMAAFTLMFVPVIANGIILILQSAVFGYGEYFTVADCMTWIGCNLLGLFLMFSCAVFSASLTGNSFATIAINMLIHSFLAVTVMAFGVMAQSFIYGFTEMNAVYADLIQSNFAVFVFGFMDEYFRDGISVWKYIVYFAAAVILYAGSYFLCKKRRIETASDVAGYKCLNGIFKYLVTFIITMLGFAIFSSYIAGSAFLFGVIVAIISVIAYAASEMLLKKTLNVLYAWKGYVCFAVFFAAVVGVFSHTSFFGYETRVPDNDEIKSASIYSYYYGEFEPFSTDKEIIAMITDAHAGFVQDEPIEKINTHGRYYGAYEDITHINIKYILKNGKTMNRRYAVTYKQSVDLMNNFYENEKYKKLCEGVFTDDSAVTRIAVNYEYYEANYGELLEVIREDVMNLSYEDIRPRVIDGNLLYNIRIDYAIEDDKGEIKQISSYYIDVTDKYTNTVKWLEEKGYEKIGIENAKNVVLQE